MGPMEQTIRPRNGFSWQLRELWSYRELFYFFAWRDLKVKYKQTLLGVVWVLLQPLLLMLVFHLLVFRNIASSSFTDIPYPLYFMLGHTLWMIFSAGVSQASESMVLNSHIIKKVYFPRVIIPAASTLTALVDWLITLPMLVGMLIYYQGTYYFDGLILACCLPLAILWVCVATFGVGIFLASINVKYRDFRYVLPFMLQALYFLSPVIYAGMPLSGWSKWLCLNPFWGPLMLMRAAFTASPLPAEALVYSGLATLVVLALGIYRFRRTEQYMADLL